MRRVFLALALGPVLMIVGGLAELVFGVKAGRRRLEGIAKPLTAESAVRSGMARAGAAARGPSPAVAARSPTGS